jgi:hypothetical protein
MGHEGIGQKRKAYKVLVRKHDRKRPHTQPKCNIYFFVTYLLNCRYLYNIQWKDDWWTVKDFEQTSPGIIKAIIRMKGLRGSMKNIRWCPRQDWIWETSKWKCRTLRLCHPAQWCHIKLIFKEIRWEVVEWIRGLGVEASGGLLWMR